MPPTLSPSGISPVLPSTEVGLIWKLYGFMWRHPLLPHSGPSSDTRERRLDELAGDSGNHTVNFSACRAGWQLDGGFLYYSSELSRCLTSV